jgi:release factor glutamine methyltransferase
MNPLVHKVLSPLLGLVKWYLSKPRKYSFSQLSLVIHPGVFHPGLFFSTSFLADYILTLPLQGSRVIEVGCGSGLLSLVAARKGATVTALDISRDAVNNTRLNADKNHLSLRVIQSDLFDACPPNEADWIFINPPYYPKMPVMEQDHAWYCGEDHAYFRKLFHQLQHTRAMIIMVLSDVCDLNAITQIAGEASFVCHEIQRKRVWADGNNYLYRITQIGTDPGAGNKRNVDTPN